MAGGEAQLGHGGWGCKDHGAPNWAAREHHQHPLNKPQPYLCFETAGARGSTAVPHGRGSAMAGERVPAIQTLEQAQFFLCYELSPSLVPPNHPK
jgi:hypothetical protein